MACGQTASYPSEHMFLAWLYRPRGLRGPASAPGWLLASLLAVAPAAAIGCGGQGVDTFDSDTEPEQTPLAFADPGTLELKPTQVVEIEILTDRAEDVTLLLLGDALDASLQQAVVRASGDGHAFATLTAPSQPTTFVVRAQIGSESFAELHVAVSEQGFTTLRITPKYQGTRELEGWSADVVVGGQCATLLATYPQDPVGALHIDGTSQDVLELGSVPVGPQLALAVQSGSLVAGCVTFAASNPGGTEDVEVAVLDRPMALGDAKLDIQLDFEPEPTAYGELVESSGRLVADVAFPSNASLPPLLLDTIGLTLSAQGSQSLQALRESGELDAAVALTVGDFDANAFCHMLAQNASIAAVTRAADGTSSIEGLLVGTADRPEKPSFQLVSFGDLDAEQLGAPPAVPFAWNATVEDVLVISGLLPVSPTRLAGAFMSVALSESLGFETSVLDGLKSSVDCASVAAQITSYGEVSGCDEQCLAAACEQALATRWQLGIEAGDSTDGSSGSLQIGISGATEVDTDLLPVELQGSWLGTLSAPEHETAISGAAEGHAPPPR